jgi:DUF1016 N-terminal domain
MSIDLVFYGELLDDLKTRIRRSQLKVSLVINAEIILLYWDIRQTIHQRQQQEGWGTGVIPRLSKDIRNELPELRGCLKSTKHRCICPPAPQNWGILNSKSPNFGGFRGRMQSD